MTGSISASSVEGMLIFVGLFSGMIPQCRSVAGALLMASGCYRLERVPDGKYQIMAAALPLAEDPTELLLPGDALRVGHGEAPDEVVGSRANVPVDISLRPLQSTDPPVLLALPATLLEQLGPVADPQNRL